MSHEINHLGQPIGAPLEGWVPPAPLKPFSAEGRYCRLEPLEARHIAPLFDALAADETNALWTYLPVGPYASAADMMSFLDLAAAKGWAPVAIIDKASGHPLGTASYMRIDAANGSAEIGAVIFSPALQRSRIGSEAIILMIRHMFERGYRRCEWKCNALNEASCKAALRYGFSYEGVFRQLMVLKGHNRDTAWFASIDSEWPLLRAAYDTWLDPLNFDEDGRQVQRLSDLTRPLLYWPEKPKGV